MSDENTWTIQSIDISGVGKAPDVVFTLADDRMSMTATPPGGHIQIDAESVRGDDEFRSRITLTNTLTGSVYADVVARHVTAAELLAEWNDATLYAGELACSLYWSMWRMQQHKAQQEASEARRRRQEDEEEAARRRRDDELTSTLISTAIDVATSFDSSPTPDPTPDFGGGGGDFGGGGASGEW